MSDGPPKRLLPESKPLPVPFGAAGGGVGLADLGVGAEDDALDGAAFTSAILSCDICVFC